jgi:shikimate kinase
MRKIFLIGYMGAGKTTVGKRLAQKMGLQFIDLDLFIENRYRKKIGEIFAEKGETAFREMERRALLEVSQFEDVIISTGGGAPCFFDNMAVMNNLGKTIYLKVPLNELVTRLTVYKHSRPLIQGKDPEEMKQFIADSLDKREVWYNQASIIFDVTKSLSTPQEVDFMVDSLIKIIDE